VKKGKVNDRFQEKTTKGNRKVIKSEKRVAKLKTHCYNSGIL
jgi:hypothetical protein